MTKKKQTIYVYPKFDSFLDIGIRIGGFGLANCLFVYSRALVLANQNGYQFINPTWQRFGIGQYLRREKDKRHYFNIFKKEGIAGIRKYLILYFSKWYCENVIPTSNSHVRIVISIEGVDSYFSPLLPYQKLIKQKLYSISRFSINGENYKYSIGIHIRLGDFVSEYRTPVDWYIEKINQIKEITNNLASFVLFSDGSDEELKNVLKIENVKRNFSQNAFLDILGLSECALILGSDSTFSGWAVFLGQKPAVFLKKHYGNVLLDKNYEIILKQNEELPSNVKQYLSSHFNLKFKNDGQNSSASNN